MKFYFLILVEYFYSCRQPTVPVGGAGRAALYREHGRVVHRALACSHDDRIQADT